MQEGILVLKYLLHLRMSVCVNGRKVGGLLDDVSGGSEDIFHIAQP